MTANLQPQLHQRDHPDLDRANLNNAYVSGMKEDIHYKGNDFTYANSLFTAGYIVGQLPSALILSSNRVPPRVWLPGCVFAWGVLTLGLACECCWAGVSAAWEEAVS